MNKHYRKIFKLHFRGDQGGRGGRVGWELKKEGERVYSSIIRNLFIYLSKKRKFLWVENSTDNKHKTGESGGLFKPT